ncbi:unnamed protein product [Pylaiella littoralis]
MSESVVFELKLQIQHLEEKLTFLAGGTNGAELVAVLMEKDAELEQNNKKLKEVEASRFQLAESAKRVDAKRRELLRQSEHRGIRVQALEKELDRQLEISGEQRRQISDSKESLASTKAELRKTQAEMASKEATAQESLAAARDEASSLQRMVEGQREAIAGLEAAKNGLEETVKSKEDEVKSIEQRKKDVANRSREMKNNLEKLLLESHDCRADLVGQRDSLEAENGRLRRRLDEKNKQLLEEQRKITALTRQIGSLNTDIEAAKEDITSAAQELAAVQLAKEESDEHLLGKDRENTKLRNKNEGLRVEMDRRLHLLNQEKRDLTEKLEEAIRELKEKESFFDNELEVTRRENDEMQEAQSSQISDIEGRLKKADEDNEHLKAEARKMMAKSKSDARQRARLEDDLARTRGDLERVTAEGGAMKTQKKNMILLEAENNHLKERIGRQENFHKRRMEKEKMERRGIARSGSTGSGRAPPVRGGISSARAAAHLLPLPPLMGYGYDDDDDGGGGGGGGGGSGHRGSSRRRSSTPTSAGGGGGGGGDGDEGGGGGERGGGSGSGSGSGSGRHGSPCFFDTPESSVTLSVADKENRGQAQQRRAPAWEGGGGSSKVRPGSSGSKGSGVSRVASSAASIVAGAAVQPPLESSKIRRVARSPVTRGLRSSSPHQSTTSSSSTSRATSRGRSSVAAKVAAPRSSSLGIQSRASSGWR